jgi:hypothetical protein
MKMTEKLSHVSRRSSTTLTKARRDNSRKYLLGWRSASCNIVSE